ncbi:MULTISPECIES: hypothetical protein [Dehalobacter]|uniref:Uncharacterized protein n=2 Tax=Dehalobacter restrictus TaxID=55583 RepID=A0A857DK93_9FIRM|nr:MULTISPECIES: hypothetical protein [Dehalobacter]AHF10516.1 hypothetical protein DEHRE_11010 [Dehalobacter restrictus DSM 9455]MCG1025438.1 hypothetical protein [Dehalobacter sp.]MDJ0305683.1 hypothetical protein [Dehalobacter sp.]OCZ51111.1 hypothetical protein A7D23_13560 [Dehalobacter sp. TeCB1]QHA01141.1 hypothetical protein GQ588_11095 [Dehalobacter restrictus]
MDIITFIIIAVVIYSFFANKDKPPQRRPVRPEDNRPLSEPLTTEMDRDISRMERKKKGNFFEDLERQLRESVEKAERELQAGPYGSTVKKKAAAPPTSASSVPRKAETVQKTENKWREEGRSDYDRYISNEGTQGIEGLGGDEGTADQEGTWGAEGSDYTNRQIIPRDQISQKRQAFGFGLSSSEVMRGVIWAEVLKEPRARRAFPRR